MNPESLEIGPALRARVERNLATFARRPVSDPGLARAAVALVIAGAEDDDTACIIITRRGRHLRRHRGQWALPGGRLDPGEDAVTAARRELAEEIGLVLGPDEVLGRLDDYPTRSGYAITPVVLWGGRRPHVVANPDEVATVYRVPLAELLAPAAPRVERIPESDRPVLSMSLAALGASVYTPTAAALYQLREVALRGRATRVREFDQPVFAWR